MKKILCVSVLTFAAMIAVPQESNAQFLKKLGKAVENVGKEVINSVTDSLKVSQQQSTTTTTTQKATKLGTVKRLERQATVEKATTGAQTTAAGAQSSTTNTASVSTNTTSANTTQAGGQFANVKVVTGHPDFKITLTRCIANDKTVLLEMTLLNVTDNDEELNVNAGYRDVKFYDNLGNIYEGKNVKVKLANHEYTNYNDNMNFVSNMPVKVSYMISDVSLNATEFVLADIRTYIPGMNVTGNIVKLRNIPIER